MTGLHLPFRPAQGCAGKIENGASASNTEVILIITPYPLRYHADRQEAAGVFDALCVNGEVTLPPTETFYSVFHSAVTDKFGVNWNVVAEKQPK